MGRKIIVLSHYPLNQSVKTKSTDTRFRRRREDDNVNEWELSGTALEDASLKLQDESTLRPATERASSICAALEQ